MRSDLPSVDVDVGFTEIFDAIDWFPPPLMLDGEVRYGRIGFVSDFMYLGLERGRRNNARAGIRVGRPKFQIRDLDLRRLLSGH